MRYEGGGLTIGGDVVPAQGVPIIPYDYSLIVSVAGTEDKWDDYLTKTRHQNKHLNSSEVAILKARAWEEAHRDKDGPAHRLFREHGIDLGQPLAILHAADLELPTEEALGDRIVPGEWPWPEQSLSEICERLSTRSSAERVHSE